MPPAELRPGTPEHWMARAKGHLSMARQPKPSGVFWEDLAFHAQQAAELAIKAVYQLHNTPFPFTHDLERLASGLRAMNIEPPETIRQALQLTRYAVRTRYPGLAPPVSEHEFAEALRQAEAVLAWAEGITKEKSEP